MKIKEFFLKRDNNKYLVNIFPFFFCIIFLTVFYSLSGASFYQSVNELSSEDYWQFLPHYVLKYNFLEAIIYLHSRPPLGNILLGIGIFTGIGAKIFIWLNHLSCALIFYYTFRLVHLLSNGRRFSFIVFLIVIYFMSLNILVFLHDIVYTMSVAAFILGISWHSMQIIREQKKIDIWCFILLSALLSLYRATYGLPFLCTFIALFAINNRKIAPFLSISFLPVVLFSLKNYLIFGFFGLTTLLGLTLYNNAAITNISSKSDAEIVKKLYPKLIKENPRYRVIIKIDTLRKISVYEKEGYRFKTIDKFEGIPALQRIEGDSWWGDSNKNAYEYIELSDTTLDLSKKLILGNPLNYIKNCGNAFFFFLKPSWMYKQQMQGTGMSHNTHPHLFSFFKLPEVDNRIRSKYGMDVSRGYDLFPYAFFTLIFVLIVTLLKPLILSRIEALFFLTIIFFGTASSILISYAESMRYKFEIEPLVYALFFGSIGYMINYLCSSLEKPDKLSPKTLSKGNAHT